MAPVETSHNSRSNMKLFQGHNSPSAAAAALAAMQHVEDSLRARQDDVVAVAAAAAIVDGTVPDHDDVLVMGSQPGFLTLSPARTAQLVAQDALDRWYTLENQPFAR